MPHISIWKRLFVGLFLKGRTFMMKYSASKENGIETCIISYFLFEVEELRPKIDFLLENSFEDDFYPNRN